ncbi:heterokaryon incompatibility protein-domain-containing protein [Tricladium varicosporioides]|nr:heterokaryon incompatibility protein-domain-containing protein [Hymenoscyphus varicosporioides]
MRSPNLKGDPLYLCLRPSTNSLQTKTLLKPTQKIPANEVNGQILTLDSGISAIRYWLHRKACGNAASRSPTVLDLVTPIPVLNSSLPLKTLSHTVLQQAMNWIKICVTSHAKCKVSTDGVLPARLIDLKDVQQLQFIRIVRVSVLSSLELKYATLSYCWGGKTKLQLKRSNASTLETGVSVGTLPKTIQDAVHFTAALGLRWLWVDSLCIIQDSAEDMAHEVRSMYGIYQNCFISIAALDAKHSDEGLYACRDPLMYAECELARTSKEQVMVTHMGYSRDIHNKVPPLYTRGWVVQERILPPRTIILGRTVAWECRETTKAEFNGAARATPFSTIKSGFFNTVTESKGKLAVTDDELAKIRKAWSNIFSVYVKTNLTFKSDRLSAISAVISAIQARTNWQNVGGLWVPFLFTELLWRRKSLPSGSYRTGISPSWTWASVECESMGFFDPIFKRLVEVDVEDGDVECLKNGNVSSDKRPIAIRVSGTPMELHTVEYDYGDYESGGHTKYCAFKVFPRIHLNEHHWIPDTGPNDNYPWYFLPFAQLKYGDIVGLGLSRKDSLSLVFERKGYLTISYPKKEVKQILHFLKEQTKITCYIV